VTKFTNRGNEHDHGLRWIEDSPTQKIIFHENIETFIERYILCNNHFLEE
jgi:hypothetical protein